MNLSNTFLIRYLSFLLRVLNNIKIYWQISFRFWSNYILRINYLFLIHFKIYSTIWLSLFILRYFYFLVLRWSRLTFLFLFFFYLRIFIDNDDLHSFGSCNATDRFFNDMYGTLSFDFFRSLFDDFGLF